MTTRAAQIELLTGPLTDPTTGSICSGYSVEFYAAGTSTAKNVWTEKEKTNPFTTYTLDSGGKALLYGDGVYKIVIKNTDGTVILTLDNQKIQSANFSVSTKTGTYTATPEDDVILCNGTFTVNLQTVANFEHPVVIINIGSGTVTIDPYSSETIDSVATKDVAAGITAQLFPDTSASMWREGYNRDTVYAPIAKGVTNGDSHDHAGGDGGQLVSSSINFLQAGTDAVTRTTQAKLRDVAGAMDFGAVGDGGTDDRTALNTANTNAVGQVYYAPGTYLVGSNLTLTKPIVMAPGAKFLVATGVTLTLNCKVQAGLNQIFSWDGTGKVLFGSGVVNQIYPEWWGALTDGTDGTSAIQACFDASMNSTFRPRIFFQCAIYTHATALTITYPQGMRLQGAAGGYYTPQAAGYTDKVTTLYYTGAGNALILGDGSHNGTGFVMENIYLKGTSSALGGCILNTVSGLVFRDCTFGQFTKSGGYGFYQTNGQVNSFYNCSFIDNYYGTSLGVGTAENSTTKFYDCVWHSNTNHAFKIEHCIGSIILYSPLFQNNEGSAIFVDGTIGPKPIGGIKMYNGYIAGNNESVAGAAIDIRGSAESGAASWATGIVIRDPYFASPGTEQIASIRLRNTTGTVIDNIVFGSIATDEIIAATSDNSKVSIEKWKYASTYIKDAAGGNVVYWHKELIEDDVQKIFRGGDILIHQEDAAGAVAPLTLQQSDVSEAILKVIGSEDASAAESISTWTTGGTLTKQIKIDINGTPYWLRAYTAPTS